MKVRLGGLRPGRAAGLVAAALAVATTARAEAPGGCDRVGPGARAVRAVAEGIIAADNARDLERVLGYYAPDAVLLPPGEPPVQGRAAIRPRYEGLFARFDPAIVARVDEVCVDGDLAYVRGHNGGRLVAREGGTSRALDDTYLMVLRRSGEGNWQISQLMWHPAGSPAPGPTDQAVRSPGP
ncbi:MAG: SgcJ/EcaC family oxidoreductase [Gemmatimonadales bacterium]